MGYYECIIIFIIYNLPDEQFHYNCQVPAIILTKELLTEFPFNVNFDEFDPKYLTVSKIPLSKKFIFDLLSKF